MGLHASPLVRGRICHVLLGLLLPWIFYERNSDACMISCDSSLTAENTNHGIMM
jgi:hypothetical protein